MRFTGFLVGGLSGAAFGLLAGRMFEWSVLGAITGFVIAMFARERSVARAAAMATTATAADARIALLERRLDAVESALQRAGRPASDPAASPPPPPPPSPPALAPTAAAAASIPRVAAVAVTSHTAVMPTAAIATADAVSPSPAAATGDRPAPGNMAALPRTRSLVWAWLTGGNTPARVGIVVLLIGVAFLLKYASEHVRVPIEVRTSIVALGGIALLALGWRLREQRRLYAMILQGGGVGVLYLTVFAAFRLYALLPVPLAFGLLAAIAALSAFLAVRQDAIALAVAAVIGGFLAPILASSGDGSHVLLFAYYAVLNAGIFGIAWFKAWRPLNLLGFACTFVVATAWGFARYHDADFATTEPFLVLFFLFYVGIAVLYAVRRSQTPQRYVDGTLVFGTPLVAAGLQQGLTRPFEFGMAISAIAAAALYLSLARVLWARRGGGLRLLVESLLALGIVCATLAVPLAFGARLTSAAWAIEGAAITWIGIRQRRGPARAFGILLQVAAGISYAFGDVFGAAANYSADALPLLNSHFIGALLVATAALVTAFVYLRNAQNVWPGERILSSVALALGALWWAGAGVGEIDRFVAQRYANAALVAFATLTAIGFALAARRLAWPAARVPALLLGPLLLCGALIGVAAVGVPGGHLFGGGGAFAWPIAIVVVALLNRPLARGGVLDASPSVQDACHAAAMWLVAVVAAEELSWFAARYVAQQGAWHDIGWAIAPAVTLALAGRLASRGVAPFALQPRAYLVVGAVPLVVWMLAWSLAIGVASSADPTPLPYVPFFNPVDVTFAIVAATLIAWARDFGRLGVESSRLLPSALRVRVGATLAFLWLNAVALRTLHHWFGAAWSLRALWQSTLAQATLSLLWAVIALAAMAIANRRRARAGWMTGAALLAAVVVKLFAVDFSHIGGIERIVSFIGVGLLLLLIGYLAPVPPRRQGETP